MGRARRVGPPVPEARLSRRARSDRLRRWRHGLDAGAPRRARRSAPTALVAAVPQYLKSAFLGRVRVRLELGAVVRARGPRVLPEATGGHSVHARDGSATAREPTGCADIASATANPMRGSARSERIARSNSLAAAGTVAQRSGASGAHVNFTRRRRPGRTRTCRLHATARLPLPVAQQRLRDVRRFPRDVSRRQAQEGEARATQGRRVGHRVPHAARRGHRSRALWNVIFGFSERTFLRHGNGHYLNVDFLVRVCRGAAGLGHGQGRRARRRRPSPRRSSSKAAAGCTAATGARRDTRTRCISRPATTRASSTASSAACSSSTRARRANTRSRAASSRRARPRRTGSSTPASARPCARYLERERDAHRRLHRGGPRAPAVPARSVRPTHDPLAASRPIRPTPFRRSTRALAEPGRPALRRRRPAPRRGCSRRTGAASFPGTREGQPILWWSPDPRMVLLPDEFRISRSLAKTLRNRGFRVTLRHLLSRR